MYTQHAKGNQWGLIFFPCHRFIKKWRNKLPRDQNKLNEIDDYQYQ